MGKVKSLVCGIDEVGRGALAGPLVGAGVSVSDKVLRLIIQKIGFIGDSKSLTKSRRIILFHHIQKFKIPYQLAYISVNAINQNGIVWANKKLFQLLIHAFPADFYVIDGSLSVPDAKLNVFSCVRGDKYIVSVMFASIVAKVTRDMIMSDLHERYPQYGWERNAGYGTREHIESLYTHGPTIYHRRVYVETVLSRRITLPL